MILFTAEAKVVGMGREAPGTPGAYAGKTDKTRVILKGICPLKVAKVFITQAGRERSLGGEES